MSVHDRLFALIRSYSSSISIQSFRSSLHRLSFQICIKIEAIPGEAPKMVGRHFKPEDQLVSRISRESIDAVKNYFQDDMTNADWRLMIELKKDLRHLITQKTARA